MGLLKAGLSATSSTFGDQFKEFVTCPQIGKDVLIQRGEVNHGKGNTKYEPGVISNGSKIVVPAGCAMMVIDNGAIKEFSAEPGEYIWDKGSESSIFTGGLGSGIINIFKTIGKRFSYGGQPAVDQRVYYVNLLVITGNKFGSPQPKKITDEKYGMLEVTFFGEYAFKVTDPITLVQNVIGSNPKDTVLYEDIIGSQLKSKFVEQLTKAITIVMRKHKVPFGDMGMYGSDISEEMNTILDELWKKSYGLEITDVAIADINLTDESMKRVNKIDDAMIFSNPSMQSGLMAGATADAMKGAATNENGSMMGFMGMNMAQMQGANIISAINQNTSSSAPQFQQQNQPEPGTLFKKEDHENKKNNLNNSENIENEKTDTKPKFCSNCGNPVNGKFCSNCGHAV